MSNKRASIRRARKEKAKMEHLKAVNKSPLNIELTEYQGKQDGKLYGILAICHVLYSEYGWKAKRCMTFIDRASDDTLRTDSEETNEIILLAWQDKVMKAMPEIKVKIDPSKPTMELLKYGVYCDARNFCFQIMCIFVLDTLGDMSTYNFGPKRLNRILELMAEQYQLMQEKPLKYFEERCKKEIGVEFG